MGALQKTQCDIQVKLVWMRVQAVRNKRAKDSGRMFSLEEKRETLGQLS